MADTDCATLSLVSGLENRSGQRLTRGTRRHRDDTEMGRRQVSHRRRHSSLSSAHYQCGRRQYWEMAAKASAHVVECALKAPVVRPCEAVELTLDRTVCNERPAVTQDAL